MNAVTPFPVQAVRTPAPRLGLTGLPPLLDCMVTGGLYSAVAESPPARFALTFQALAANLILGYPCSLITGALPDDLLARAARSGFSNIARAVQTGQLVVFTLRDNFSRNIFRFGVDRLVAELAVHGLPSRGFLVVDMADEMFTFADHAIALRQARAYRQWLDSAGTTALFLFNNVDTQPHLAHAHQTILDQCQGSARITKERDHFDYAVDFWRTPDGTVSPKTLAAQFNKQGHLCLNTVDRKPALTASTAPQSGSVPDDHSVVFYMDADLAPLARSSTRTWQMADSLVGVLHLCNRAKAPLVVLSYAASSDLRQLAQAIHTLRTNLDPRARLVVREKNISLRYQNELLLLRLGANLIIHRDIPLSRIPLMLESLNGQTFQRNMVADFEKALASVTSNDIRGYLHPSMFGNEVERILDRARVLGAPSAMACLTPNPGVTLFQVAEQLNLPRDGDLITATTNSLFLFLSNCPEASLLSVIDRISNNPVASLFNVTSTATTPAAIRSEIVRLNELALRHGWVDLSKPQRTAMPGSTSTAVA